MKKNKKELIEEANKLSEENTFKKNVIESILNDLDGKKDLNDKHLEAIGIIQALLIEMDEIQVKHQDIVKQIKS